MVFSDIGTLTQLIAVNRSTPRYITCYETGADVRRIRNDELHHRALQLLALWQDRGLKPGDKVLIYIQENEGFLYAFWAATLGGFVPVPVAMGAGLGHLNRLLRIAQMISGAFLYTSPPALEAVCNFATQQASGEFASALRARAILSAGADLPARHGIVHTSEPQDVALIQFSSGSTATPKGVVLTHRNLIANCRAILSAASVTDRDVVLSWMPLTHDMGLIAMHLAFFMGQANAHLMRTELFVRRPLLWLELASELSATVLSSPNFGYSYYLKALAQNDVAHLRLDRVRMIMNGAEPISMRVARAFIDKLAGAGLQTTAMFPVYGLAEATVAVTSPPPHQAPTCQIVDRRLLALGDAVRIVDAESPHAIEILSEGRAVPGCRVRLCGANDALLADGHVGHVQVSGDSVMRGYYADPDATAAALTADGWLRTGDLAFRLNGDLHLCGRLKELIIVNGQNFYPHDIEDRVCEALALEPGRVVAASYQPRGADSEALALFVVHRSSIEEFPKLAKRLLHTVNDICGVGAFVVVPIARVPKTTSGKLQRHLLIAKLSAGEFDTPLREIADLQHRFSLAQDTPQTRIAASLLAICSSVIPSLRVEPDDNLFELGVSSLTLTQIHDGVSAIYPRCIDIAELYEYPTIAAIAACIALRIEGSRDATVTPMLAAPGVVVEGLV